MAQKNEVCKRGKNTVREKQLQAHAESINRSARTEILHHFQGDILTQLQVPVLFLLESPFVVYEEDGGLELRSWLAGRRGFRFNDSSRVVEPELDMRRPTPHPSAISEAVTRVIRWMTPDHSATRAPMRSVARELEEAFPSRDN